MSGAEEAEAEPAGTTRPLFVIRRDASDEEVAALTAVLAAMAAAATRDAARPPRPAWSAPRRRLRGGLLHGPGGWRASALPG